MPCPNARWCGTRVLSGWSGHCALKAGQIFVIPHTARGTLGEAYYEGWAGAFVPLSFDLPPALTHCLPPRSADSILGHSSQREPSLDRFARWLHCASTVMPSPNPNQHPSLVLLGTPVKRECRVPFSDQGMAGPVAGSGWWVGSCYVWAGRRCGSDSFCWPFLQCKALFCGAST